jgi:nuclear protein localization family protein 4
VGTWRHDAAGSTKLSALLAQVEHEHGVKIVKVARKPDLSDVIPHGTQGGQSLDALGIKHGDMLFLDATGASKKGELVNAHGAKVIDSHGNLVAGRGDDGAASFRPGLQALRTQKLHWTLTDMVEFDNKYTFEVKGEQLSFCSSTSLDGASLNAFQLYLQQTRFESRRCAYLYGSFVPGEDIAGSVEHKAKVAKGQPASKDAPRKAAASVAELGKKRVDLKDLEGMRKEEAKPRQGAVVQAVYEPLQRSSASGFTLLEDPREARVEAIARGLGLRKVGFLFSHPPGRAGYTLSAPEIIYAGEQALEATAGLMDSAFVIIKCTSEQGSASFDAFSLTPQCLEMVAEDALLAMEDNPGHAAINETFTLIVEKKQAHVVDTDFFIKRVPILSHASPLACSFPRFNRELGPAPGADALKQSLGKLGRSATDAQIAKAIADMSALLFIAELVEEIEEIARFVASHVVPGQKPLPLSEGHKVVILGIAGIEL